MIYSFKTLKNLMRALIIGMCLFLGSIGFAANQVWNAAGLQTQINAAANSKLMVAAGTYSVSTTLTCVAGLDMEGDGPVKIYSTANPIFDGACQGLKLRKIWFIGTAGNFTGYGAPGNPTNSGQIGVRLYNPQDVVLDEVKITNVNGSCLDVQAPATTWQNAVHVNKLIVSHCYRGVWAHNYAEYLTFVMTNASENVFGIQVDSGNVSFTATKANKNSVAVKICGATSAADPYCDSPGNNAHGIFTDLMANHSEYAISVKDVTLGQTFTGVHAIGGLISPGNSGTFQVINSKGVNISGCQLGVNFTIDSTSQIAARNCYVRTDLPGYAAPAAPGGGSFGTFFGSGNFGPAGMLPTGSGAGYWNN